MKAFIYIEGCGLVSIPQKFEFAKDLVIVAKGGKNCLAVQVLEFGEKTVSEDSGRPEFLRPSLQKVSVQLPSPGKKLAIKKALVKQGYQNVVIGRIVYAP
ncbi:MAG: hypothetical protein UX26_C0009G0017 [Parcubacteria group bacterium GW2011_GWC1_45_9]|nr:MAG: hypothetical protein UW85_C0010G0021 [Parcubacteria group bacterium GW2011_GWA1_Parcubacteria_45_10]KKT88612.1 MAG: hypothetical protein UW89_C0006G0020 [Parcubacteria group bacterium GW2011_GWB1_45_10]KKU17052.1 MAG: hypothetical protein UX26_C0009G0017 [Parcubacteria group bacterium GW2011_GWC1_45_9]HCI05268.1 hypothetical protein [Patescibacteria group bacterium]